MSSLVDRLSARPIILVDEAGHGVVDPAGNFIGCMGPFGRGRMVAALPLNKDGPVQVAGPEVLEGICDAFVVDPQGNYIGHSNPIWVNRILDARWVEDTRRLAG